MNCWFQFELKILGLLAKEIHYLGKEEDIKVCAILYSIALCKTRSIDSAKRKSVRLFSLRNFLSPKLNTNVSIYFSNQQPCTPSLFHKRIRNKFCSPLFLFSPSQQLAIAANINANVLNASVQVIGFISSLRQLNEWIKM